MRRFLVVSYDGDTQLWYHDFVFAVTAEIAKAGVCAVRPYVLDADAIPLHELTRMARGLRKDSRTNADAFLLMCANEAGVKCACRLDKSRIHEDACPLHGFPRKPFVHKPDCHIPKGSADCSCKP